jgi:hypothetical protein
MNLTPVTERLTNAERDELNAKLARDGFVLLPHKLPSALMDAVLAAIDRLTAEKRQQNAAVKSVKMHNRPCNWHTMPSGRCSISTNPILSAG